MIKNIAVVAHNKMKPALAAFLQERKDWLWGRKIIATGLTADALVSADIDLDIMHLSEGKSGGYLELKKMVEEGEIAMVLYFRDSDLSQEYEDEVSAFINACNRQNIPLATNPASAELLILGLIKKEAAELIKSRTEADLS
ncbi:MAG: methylglyoxal synthase [Flavobacteriales bacterium]|jgi:methylglyoxal synthase|nr:methylglyoxal synthase [Flavobacteriales bacterium]MDG1765882.1 methylglyoxal synthase [Flavobacteriales bacterium]